MKRLLAIWLALVCTAGATLDFSATIDYAYESVPTYTVYQASERSWVWTVRNYSATQDITGQTPFMYWATSNTAHAVVTAQCAIVVATSGTFRATFTPTDLNYTGRVVYGVGLIGTNGNAVVARQGALVIVADPYASGAGAITWTTNVDWNTITWLNLPGFVSSNLFGDGFSWDGTHWLAGVSTSTVDATARDLATAANTNADARVAQAEYDIADPTTNYVRRTGETNLALGSWIFNGNNVTHTGTSFLWMLGGDDFLDVSHATTNVELFYALQVHGHVEVEDYLHAYSIRLRDESIQTNYMRMVFGDGLLQFLDAATDGYATIEIADAVADNQPATFGQLSAAVEGASNLALAAYALASNATIAAGAAGVLGTNNAEAIVAIGNYATNSALAPYVLNIPAGTTATITRAMGPLIRADLTNSVHYIAFDSAFDASVSAWPLVELVGTNSVIFVGGITITNYITASGLGLSTGAVPVLFRKPYGSTVIKGIQLSW